MNFDGELSLHATFSIFRTGSNQSYVITHVLTSSSLDIYTRRSDNREENFGEHFQILCFSDM